MLYANAWHYYISGNAAFCLGWCWLGPYQPGHL